MSQIIIDSIRSKDRYESPIIGQRKLTVEELWGTDPEVLKQMAQELDQKLTAVTKPLFESDDMKLTAPQLRTMRQRDVLVFIVNTLSKESHNNELAKANRDVVNEFDELIAAKRKEDLAKMSLSELIALRDKAAAASQ